MIQLFSIILLINSSFLPLGSKPLFLSHAYNCGTDNSLNLFIIKIYIVIPYFLIYFTEIKIYRI